MHISVRPAPCRLSAELGAGPRWRPVLILPESDWDGLLTCCAVSLSPPSLPPWLCPYHYSPPTWTTSLSWVWVSRRWRRRGGSGCGTGRRCPECRGRCPARAAGPAQSRTLPAACATPETGGVWVGPTLGVAYLDIVVHGAGLAVGGGQLRGLEVLSAAGLAARRPTRPCTLTSQHSVH